MTESKYVRDEEFSDSDIIKAIGVFTVAMCDFIRERKEERYYLSAEKRHTYAKMTALLDAAVNKSDEYWPRFSESKTEYLIGLVNNLVEIMLQVADPSIEHKNLEGN